MSQATRKVNKDFMMSPKVDVCFAGLMENPIVRKGFCSAVMRVPPETTEKTELLPTYLQRDYADDKLGILDVRVCMMDGTQINMEMQVLELKKLPKKVRTGEDIVNWMCFFNGKSKSECNITAEKVREILG